jgi:hypothetical protein
MVEYQRVPLLLRLLYRVTLFWRRRISRFEVLGEDQRNRLLEIGIPPERIVLKRDPSPICTSPTTTVLERPRGLAGYRVLLYSGNLGVAHDYTTFLQAYRLHHRDGGRRVALWLNAVGSGADALERALMEEGLPYVRTKPVPLQQLASLLVTPDAHLITLLDRFSGFVLPSKVYGCIESGRPVLYIGPTSSDVHLLCTSKIRPDSYWQINVGDTAGVLKVLEEI